MRKIEDILAARKDISPFLVHLTRDHNGNTAADNLRSILDNTEIVVGTGTVSSFNFVDDFPNLDTAVTARLRAACFSETPIDEIHCLLDIQGRARNLSQYGVMLLKETLAESNPISPVLYVNTFNDAHKDAYVDFINELYELSVQHNKPALMDFMAYFEHFGQKLRLTGEVDFHWEREWRCRQNVVFGEDDIFLGLCPHEEIDQFERDYPDIKFIDPKMNPRYYSEKIVARKQQLGMKSNLL